MEFELNFNVTLKLIKFPSKWPIIFLNSAYRLIAFIQNELGIS